ICYGFRIETDAGVLAYSGDCGPCEAMHELARDADVLIHMCVIMPHGVTDPAAMPYGALARLAQDAGVRTLIASHLNPQTDADGVREHIIAEMGEIYKGRLIWARDGIDVPVRNIG